MLIKYIKSVLWRVAKCLSYIEEARCLKFKGHLTREAHRIVYNGESKLWIYENVRFRISFHSVTCQVGRPSISVGIATGYGLHGPGIKSRWGARFSVPVQTGPGAHSALCTMGTGSFPEVKSSRGVTLTPHPLLVPRSRNRVELYFYSP